MRRFCSVCGKSTEVLHEGLCTQCFIKEHEFSSIPSILETLICKSCYRQYSKGGWHRQSTEFEDALKDAAIKEIQNSLKIKLENAKSNIHVETIKEMKKSRFDVNCKVTTEGTWKGTNIKEVKDCTVKVLLQLCSDCSRVTGGFYEAILQIRSAGKMVENDIETISNDVASLIEEYSNEKRAFISKIDRTRGGVDFYFGSTKIARKIANTLKKREGGTLDESPKLVGKTKSGKNEYRITIILRFPKFKTNDIIEVDNRIIQVTRLRGNKITGFDLENRSKTSFPLAKIKNAKMIGGKEDLKTGIVSEITPDNTQIIDMETYKPFYISLKKSELKVGEEVEFVRHKGVHLLKLKNED